MACVAVLHGKQHSQYERCIPLPAQSREIPRRRAGLVGVASRSQIIADRPKPDCHESVALSRENLLGEKLFDFPQYNGSQGLLPSLSDTTYAHDWTKALYKHLGGKPGKNLKDNTRFLELLSQRPSATAAAKDYLLCAYLLDKNLDAFVTVLPRCHEVNDNLPLHYKEALILYNRLHTTPAITYKNSVIETNLNDFLHYGMQYTHATERSNQCRRMYGNTYWWYYYYQKPSE